MTNRNLTTESEKEQWWEHPWLILPALFVAIFIIWHAYWWIGDYFQQLGLITQKDGGKNLSNLGDWFNALSALFAGWAFAALIYTIILQRRELQQTRAEFRLQREELTTQSKTFSQQTFENTFFQMLTSLREIAYSAKISNYSGNEAFKEIYRGFVASFDSHIGSSSIKIKVGIYQFFAASCFNLHADTLAPFFRMLYMIFRLIEDNSFLGAPKKKFYADIVRAQLTKHQLILLFFYCQSVKDEYIKLYDGEDKPQGYTDITEYVKRYNTLKYLTKADAEQIDESKLNFFKTVSNHT